LKGRWTLRDLVDFESLAGEKSTVCHVAHG